MRTSIDNTSNIVRTFSSINPKDHKIIDKQVNEVYAIIKQKCGENEWRSIKDVVLSLLTAFAADVARGHDACSDCEKQKLEDGVNLLIEFRENIEKWNNVFIWKQLVHMADNNYQLLQKPIITI